MNQLLKNTSNIMLNYIYDFINLFNIKFINNNNQKKSLKRKNVSFDDNIKIQIIPNNYENQDNKYNKKKRYISNKPQIVNQYIELPKNIITDTTEDFDFFVYFE